MKHLAFILSQFFVIIKKGEIVDCDFDDFFLAEPPSHRSELRHDLVRAIAQEVAGILQASRSTPQGTSSFMTSSTNTMMVPHICTITQLLIELIIRVAHMESTLTRLCGQVSDTERRLLATPGPPPGPLAGPSHREDDTTYMFELSIGICRLRTLIESKG